MLKGHSFKTTQNNVRIHVLIIYVNKYVISPKRNDMYAKNQFFLVLVCRLVNS